MFPQSIAVAKEGSLMVTAIEGYPFERMTERFVVRAEVGSNWKLFIDAFADAANGLPDDAELPDAVARVKPAVHAAARALKG